MWIRVRLATTIRKYLNNQTIRPGLTWTELANNGKWLCAHQSPLVGKCVQLRVCVTSWYYFTVQCTCTWVQSYASSIYYLNDEIKPFFYANQKCFLLHPTQLLPNIIRFSSFGTPEAWWMYHYVRGDFQPEKQFSLPAILLKENYGRNFPDKC